MNLFINFIDVNALMMNFVACKMDIVWLFGCSLQTRKKKVIIEIEIRWNCSIIGKTISKFDIAIFEMGDVLFT